MPVTYTFTPGPWRVDDAPNGHSYIRGEHRVEIARMGSENMLADDSSARANARLVAAAPGLLACLQLLHANAGESPEWIRARIEACLKGV